MTKIFRLGHRLPRDERITTHVALTARALGSSKMYYSGTKDKGLERSVSDVVKRWGGDFSIEYVKNPIGFLKKQEVPIVHLTMYGEKFYEKMPEIKKYRDLMVVVGGEKVPGEIYKIAKWNISIGTQPHSEVAALAIFLYELNGKETLYKEYENAQIKIVPSNKKHIIRV